MACNIHKKREGGKVVPIFRGLAKQVESILAAMSNIHAIKCGMVRKYHGHSKVKIMPWSGGPEPLGFIACDEEGECELLVTTPYKGAVVRVLRRQLKKRGISFNAPEKKGGEDVEQGTQGRNACRSRNAQEAVRAAGRI